MAKEKIEVASTVVIEKYDENMNLKEVHKSKIPNHLKDKLKNHLSAQEDDKKPK